MNDHSFPDHMEVLRRVFSRHLVGLGVTYQAIDTDGKLIDEPKFHVIAGLIFSIRDCWHFLTAGHAIIKIENLLAAKKIKLHSCMLNDTFGPNAKNSDSIPFEYTSAPKYYVDNRKVGLDFGLIGLRPYYRPLLEANGILPLTEEHWANQTKQDFDRHYVLGLPEEMIRTTMGSDGDGGSALDVEVSVALIALEKPIRIT